MFSVPVKSAIEAFAVFDAAQAPPLTSFRVDCNGRNLSSHAYGGAAGESRAESLDGVVDRHERSAVGRVVKCLQADLEHARAFGVIWGAASLHEEAVPRPATTTPQGVR